jgi:3-oxoacyl-[acyl-carrier protein] reductase
MVLPGRIATDRTIELDTARANNTGMSVESVKASSEKMIPIGRYGTPVEFAALVAFLCSEDARYVTGEQIRVDGGLIRSL